MNVFSLSSSGRRLVSFVGLSVLITGVTALVYSPTPANDDLCPIGADHAHYAALTDIIYHLSASPACASSETWVKRAYGGIAANDRAKFARMMLELGGRSNHSDWDQELYREAINCNDDGYHDALLDLEILSEYSHDSLRQYLERLAIMSTNDEEPHYALWTLGAIDPERTRYLIEHYASTRWDAQLCMMALLRTDMSWDDALAFLDRAGVSLDHLDSPEWKSLRELTLDGETIWSTCHRLAIGVRRPLIDDILSSGIVSLRYVIVNLSPRDECISTAICTCATPEWSVYCYVENISNAIVFGLSEGSFVRHTSLRVQPFVPVVHSCDALAVSTSIPSFDRNAANWIPARITELKGHGDSSAIDHTTSLMLRVLVDVSCAADQCSDDVSASGCASRVLVFPSLSIMDSLSEQ